jgi:uncharacterized sporulation protein YeaH/YhbH (DUF444 family)
MTYFIDRRLNPKGKSLANRQRFLRRATGGFAARLFIDCARRHPRSLP